jgi:MFS family permease
VARSRAHRLFLAAAGASSLGDGLLVTALPLLAREATNQPLRLAAITGAARIPWLFGIVLGALADRRDARLTMVFADGFRAIVLVVAAIYLVVNDGRLPLVLLGVVSALLGVGSILFYSASQRVLPRLVADSELESANGSLQTVTISGEYFVGPALGTSLLGSGLTPLLGDAASFIASAALLAQTPPVPPSPTNERMWTSVAVGLAWFRGSVVLQRLTAYIALATALYTAVLATEVVLVRDTLGLSNRWFGLFAVTLSAGALVGSFVAARIIRVFGEATLFLTFSVSALLFLACVGNRSAAIVYPLLFVQQGATVVGLVAMTSIQQRIVPDPLRGRVLAFTRSVVNVMQAGGALLGGWLAQYFSTDHVFAVVGLATLLVTAVVFVHLGRLLRAGNHRR